MACRTFLQIEAKIATLTIGKIRNNVISEYTVFTKISGFFSIIKRNLYVAKTSYSTNSPVKPEMLKLSKCALAHRFIHKYICYKLIDGD